MDDEEEELIFSSPAMDPSRHDDTSEGFRLGISLSLLTSWWHDGRHVHTYVFRVIMVGPERDRTFMKSSCPCRS